MRFTGERFIPGEVMSCIHYEHVHRYLFALPLVAGKRVLDIGSGEGYGTALLAEAAHDAVGIDASVEAVAHAAGKYGSEKVRYLAGDGRRLSFVDGSFDCIVSFETLEHVPDGEAILHEAARVLRPGGLLIVSSPNKSFYHRHDSQAACNPFHSKEWELEEFERLIRSTFRSHRLFGQHMALGSCIWALGGDPPAKLAVCEGISASPEHWARQGELDPVYSIAVCSQSETLPHEVAGLPSLLLDNQEAVVRALEAHVADMMHHMRLKDEHIADMMHHMKLRERKIAELEKLADQPLRVVARNAARWLKRVARALKRTR